LSCFSQQKKAEVETLRRENDTLKEETGGAVGGAAGCNIRRPNRLAPQAQQLSQELRLAASTAENNLRQLLTGVDNLRIMAATLESLNDVVAPPINPNIVGTTIITESDFLSDSDENDFTGPAL
jgi:serologically defined colon cancer antigen 3